MSALRRTIWVDVEDFFHYFKYSPRPSGIQRLVFEVLRVLPEQARLSADGPRIGFLRHSNDETLVREVSFESVVGLFMQRSAAAAEPAGRAGPQSSPFRPGLIKRLRLGAILWIRQMPPDLAGTLLNAGVLQLATLRHAKAILRVLSGKPGPAVRVAAAAAVAFDPQPNDVFLVLGAAWIYPTYGTLLERLRAQYRLAPALLLHDLIPWRRPEWCSASHVREFGIWLETTLPQCSRLMAVSRATAGDVQAFMAEAGLRVGQAVTPLPIGTGFGPAADGGVADGAGADGGGADGAGADRAGADGAGADRAGADRAGADRAGGDGRVPPGLPPVGSYVLFVSTLEARKNHELLFRVWRRLLCDLPRERVPTLVFAGRIGWLVDDLLQQLDNAAWLDGKVRLLQNPTDAELTGLYNGCQFTLFPSLFEGWGLPVSESLALGKPCLAAATTSLPEAGGDLARYFDPENVDDAYRAVRAVIDDPDGLEAWRKRIVREFRPVRWECTADAILAACASVDDAACSSRALGEAT